MSLFGLVCQLKQASVMGVDNGSLIDVNEGMGGLDAYGLLTYRARLWTWSYFGADDWYHGSPS
jgi:hypothetical protein